MEPDLENSDVCRSVCASECPISPSQPIQTQPVYQTVQTPLSYVPVVPVATSSLPQITINFAVPECIPVCEQSCNAQCVEKFPQEHCGSVCNSQCQTACATQPTTQVQSAPAPSCQPQCQPACEPVCIAQQAQPVKIQVNLAPSAPTPQQASVQCQPMCEQSCVQECQSTTLNVQAATCQPACQAICQQSCAPLSTSAPVLQTIPVVPMAPVQAASASTQLCAPKCISDCQGLCKSNSPQCIQGEYIQIHRHT